MQVLSAYLLESGPLTSSEIATRFASVTSSIADWLTQKGATDSRASSGQFESLTKDGNGRFVQEHHSVSAGTLHDVRLEEFSRSGQIFTTRIATVTHGDKLQIHCTLAVANAVSVVAPLPTDPRCPSIVRSLLAHSVDWTLNGTPLSPAKPRVLAGESGGERLADEIRDPGRSVPIIAVSEIEGEQLWPGLGDEIAFDLAGLAQVVIIDDDATWALTDQIGKLHSCYRGAVRLYWPARQRPDGSLHFNSTVWTASMLLSSDGEGKGLARLRATLRRIVMTTAALAITPPSAIREVQDAVARHRIAELELRVSPDSEELAIARLYITENQDLKARIEQLQGQVAQVGARADAAEHALAQLKAPDIVDDNSAELQSTVGPLAGEIRFYKKTHTKGAYDVLVEVDDCGHTSWQNSAKADKARKGLERLTGRRDWKNMTHCGTCTGGGTWKVRW